MNRLLNINEKVIHDNSVTNIEFHSYQSYTSGELNYNDECRIIIQQELLTAPGESYLQIQRTFAKHDGTGKVTKCQLINNFVAFLFEEIRYELGGVIIDRVKNPGITTTMKLYISHTPNESIALMNAVWDPLDGTTFFDAVSGKFDICWPLSSILGFAEDYKKALLNLRQ